MKIVIQGKENIEVRKKDLFGCKPSNGHIAFSLESYYLYPRCRFTRLISACNSDKKENH